MAKRGAIDVMEPTLAGSSARAALVKPKGANAARDRNERRLNLELNTEKLLTHGVRCADSLILVNGALIMAGAASFSRNYDGALGVIVLS